IAFGSVAPIPVRCVQTEKVLRGNRLDDGIPRAVLDTLTTEIAPIDDIRSTASYRMRVSGNLLLDFLSNIDNS
ncbi:MAG: xanthine dehydrogenase family protein subunit M, partial [Blastocatellia bacterium]